MGQEPQLKDQLKQTIKIIDADTHYTEPHDLWLKRAPRNLKDRVPQVRQHNGKMSWVIDGDKSIGDGAPSKSAIRRNGVKPKGLSQMTMTFDECHPASYDVKERLKVMEDFGIWAEVVYPNLLGFGGQKSVIVDSALRLECVKIYNDAMGELQEESGERLFPMALLPWWNVKAAVAETERSHAGGLRGININSDPHNHKDTDGTQLPDLGHEYWNPLWEVCSALEMPVNFHIGASETSMDWIGNAPWPSLDTNLRASIGGAMLFLDNARILANIIFSKVLDRFPKLKFVSVESGIGWIPFMLEALDYHYQEFNTVVRLDREPSEYFRSNFYGCFWFEKADMSGAIRRAGVDNVLFETDFPHPTCLYPNPIDHIAEGLAGLDEESRRKVLSGNAAKVYRIPLQ